MDTSERILGYYESIGLLTRSMALAAREQDWDTLAAAQSISRTLIERLTAEGDAEARLTQSGRRRRMAILRGILDDDAEIRAHTEPSLARLDRWLSPHARRGAQP